MHNELIGILNSRKNQIPKYRFLGLTNEQCKVHPQKLKTEHVFTIDETELRLKLQENSIGSVNYGRNFIFNNFDAYQHHFLLKLSNKSEFISNIKEFIDVCFNGEAFAQSTDTSNTIAEVREYFYVELKED
jgi:hypothetical protein